MKESLCIILERAVIRQHALFFIIHKKLIAIITAITAKITPPMRIVDK